MTRNNASTRDLLVQSRLLWQESRFAEAEHAIRVLLSTDPRHADALVALSEILQATQRSGDAITILKDLIAGHPDVAGYARRLGVALLAVADKDGAVVALRRAVDLDPSNARGHNNLGEAYFTRGETERAIECYRRALACEPAHAHAHNNLGRALIRLGQHATAIDHLQFAVALAPTLTAAHINLADAFYSEGRCAEARTSYEAVLRIAPRLAHAWSGKADAEFALGDAAACLESTGRALLIDPDHLPALLTRGRALRSMARGGEALQCLERAIALNPADANTLSELGAVFDAAGNTTAARACLDRLDALAPEFPYLRGYRLFLDLRTANWSGYERRVAELNDAVARGERACSPFSALLISESSGIQRRCAETFANDRYPSRAPPALDRYRRLPHGRIRVAYVSGDFGEHAVSHLLTRVLERHDASLFEIWALSWGRHCQDTTRARIETSVERFVDASDLGDAAVIRLLRAAKIDIAVDLMGHTRGQRSAIFAGRAAPIQVNFLGFPGTTGATYMDYLIADPLVIPEGSEAAYVERIARLPHCYLPTDESRAVDTAPLNRAAAHLPRDAFVFCAFNNAFKLNPRLFDVWMRLLRAVPRSVLWLRSGDADLEPNLRREADERGVSPDRLVFAGRLDPMSAHLARYQLADLFLDTLPYNAHATACDALWAGLPLLTCQGETFCGRVGASLLMTLGLADLVTADLAEYEERALELAQDPGQLPDIRRRLAESRSNSPLFDSDYYRRNLEEAYRRMWLRHMDGATPSSFSLG